MLKFLVMVLGMVLFGAIQAEAGAWSACAGLVNTKSRCYTFTSADSTHDSGAVVMEGRFTAVYGTPGAARVYLRGPCVGAVSDANCPRVLVDTDGDGAKDETPMDGVDSAAGVPQIYENPGGVYFLEVTVAAGGGEAPVIMFQYEGK